MKPAQEWYYRTTIGAVEGPITAAELKQLADEGVIGPKTAIRKGAEGHWVTAAKVKGLMDDQPASPPPPRVKWVPEIVEGVRDEPAAEQTAEPPRVKWVPEIVVLPEPNTPAETQLPPTQQPLPEPVRQNEETAGNKEQPRRFHPAVFLGLGIVGTLLVVMLATNLGSSSKSEPPHQKSEEAKTVSKTPLEQAKETFPAYARKTVNSIQDELRGRTFTGNTITSSGRLLPYTYTVAVSNDYKYDVQQSSSVITPAIGVIDVEVTARAESAGIPVTRTVKYKIECGFRDGQWEHDKSVTDSLTKQ